MLWMQAGEFEHVMVLVVDALCWLRAPDAVHGLLVWSRDVTGRRMNWIRSAIDVANAKYLHCQLISFAHFKFISV